MVVECMGKYRSVGSMWNLREVTTPDPGFLSLCTHERCGTEGGECDVDDALREGYRRGGL